MTVAGIVRPGQANLTGSVEALFLELFSGEVLAAFHKQNKLMKYSRMRTISGGKSALFPRTGIASARYHTLGQSVFLTDDGDSGVTPQYLSTIAGKEMEIFVDDPLVAGVFIGKIEEMKNHWDVRSAYATEVATALAEQADENIARTILAAAVADPQDGSTQYSTMASGDKIIDIGTTKTGANIKAGLFDAAELFDTHNVPTEGRTCLLDPEGYYMLAQETDLVNRDWTSGNGDYAQAKINKVAGFDIVMTNSLPSSDETSGYTSTGAVKNTTLWGSAGEGVDYKPGQDVLGSGHDASRLGGLVFAPGCIGTVKMADLSTETEYFMERKGHLILSSYVMGHNILRAECAAAFEFGA